MAKSKKSTIKYASSPYTQVPDGFWICKEYNRLSSHARCIFTIALSKWNPYEPDKPFAMLYTELREITGFQFNTISKAIKRLILDGFIDRPKRGCYPNNVALYTLETRWLEKQYPKKSRAYPEYVDRDGNSLTNYGKP